MNKKCRNCGNIGHIYKNCPNPITSYGIILVNTNNYVNKFLLIQRTHTIAFSEFIFGKYSLDNPDYIKNLFKRMSYKELNILKTKPNYNILWQKIYDCNNYNYSKNSKYEKFLKKYNNFIDDLEIDYSVECEWEFPKGRRNNDESDLVCACREFKEETNIDISDIQIKNLKFYEKFKSSNNNTYLHIYYLAYLKDSHLILNKKPCSEIYQIKWFTYNESIKQIRDYSFEKKKVLNNVNDFIIKNKNLNI